MSETQRIANKLDDYLSKLREQKKQADLQRAQNREHTLTKTVGHDNVLFLGTFEDKVYVPHLKGMFNGRNTYVLLEKVELLSHLELYCAKRNVTAVVSTNTAILAKLLERQGNHKKDPKLSDYAGSLFKYAGLEIVFISPLAQLFTVRHGRFIAKRFISKVTTPTDWREATPFSWEIAAPATVESLYSRFQSAYAMAVDIETFKVNLAIRCIGYCGIWIDKSGRITTHSFVLPVDSIWALAWMRKFNELPARKIFQNGKYDNAYLLRYNAPVTNWTGDTAHQMHSWYSELPKDLGFLNAFFLREVIYWKDLAETNDLQEYYLYNAKDCWATANVWITWMLIAPAWARRNYFLEFPLVYPCLLAEMTGVKRDQERLEKARREIDEEESRLLTSLRKMIGAPFFNPGSPQQVQKLLKVLGVDPTAGTDVKAMAKARLLHPLNERILGLISRTKEESEDSIRGLRKIRSSYLRLDSDAEKGKDNGSKEYKGRVLYSLNPHGTDTGRLASREHQFWCGLQIQNIPQGDAVKQTIAADEGFYLAECDLEQAESRDTAHIAGDDALIRAVSGENDFHSVNASAFFGIPYVDLYDNEAGKSKNKPIRNIAKRVNHGANYNMGEDVLVDTMGMQNIWQTKKLLNLPYNQPRQIAHFLLSRFHMTYPKLKGGMDKPYYPGTYYADVVMQVTTTRMLVSRAYHHTPFNLAKWDADEYINAGDWTRYCFGNPEKNKLDLNSYTAHCPQSLNARTLNEAFLLVFYEVALPNPKTFRLHAQIHDSIFFSYAEGYERHAESVRRCMEIPVTVRDVSGIKRTFVVPAAIKAGKIGKDGVLKRAKYWNETE
jgi:DNA polymerase I-like protein with 3'-5' exonuclease and polymerase domains